MHYATPRRCVLTVRRFLQDENAASAAEYGILAALVAIAIITAVGLFGTKLKGLFTAIAQPIPAGTKN